MFVIHFLVARKRVLVGLGWRRAELLPLDRNSGPRFGQEWSSGRYPSRYPWPPVAVSSVFGGGGKTVKMTSSLPIRNPDEVSFADDRSYSKKLSFQKLSSMAGMQVHTVSTYKEARGSR